jgi:hypothetical protein
MKVRSDAAAEIQGFADIEHGASSVSKEIYPRLLRKFGEVRPPGMIHGA